jgi:thiamine transport system substrate-binding protein
MKHVRSVPAAGLATVVAVLALTGCTAATEPDEPQTSGTSGAEGSGEVVLVTHDSFSLPKKLVRAFEESSGLDLVVRSSGDAGQLTNKLVLTEGSPTGDVAFGVDNTFGSRALGEGVFAPSEITLPDGADAYALEGDEDGRMVPVDTGNVCVNIDVGWFEEHDLPAPETFGDLIDPRYEGLFVTPGASTSSPGLAFLLATIETYDVDWTAWWSDLVDNGAKITSGWSDAYYVDYTLGGEGGSRPIVLSYDSSPAFTLTDDGQQSTSRALPETCFRQVEYAGVLEGADNPDGGRRVLEWLLSPEVQEALPESMYVYPVTDVPLPRDWARFAPQPDDPIVMDPAEISEHREEWLTRWTDLTSR